MDSRTLVETFLLLPRHRKLKVAEAVGCHHGNATNSDEELFRVIFHHCESNKTVDNFVAAVETQETEHRIYDAMV